MKVIGLTGGIACGKSLCADELRHHFPLIDCDVVARDVVRKGRWGWRRVRKAFAGHDVFHDDGSVNRDKLGALVFDDHDLRRRLNRATHLPIVVQIAAKLAWYAVTCQPVVVVDMPLLFESRAERFMSRVVVVRCDRAAQLARLRRRNGLSEADAEARVAAQMPQDDKVARADYVIDNSGSKEAALEQVQAVISSIRKRSWLHRLLPLFLLAVPLAAIVAAVRA